MAKLIEYFFTPISPWAYLGHDRLRAIAARHGADIAIKPCNLGKVFSVSGGLPLAQRPVQRQAYRLIELHRWSTFLGLPLTVKPAHFPAPDGLAARLICAVDLAGGPALDLTGRIMRAVWAEERNLADAETLSRICDEAGLDGAAELANVTKGDEAYERFTAEAIERQVFGAPTYFYRDEPFWGQDRLDFLDRALAAG